MVRTCLNINADCKTLKYNVLNVKVALYLHCERAGLESPTSGCNVRLLMFKRNHQDRVTMDEYVYGSDSNLDH